MGSKIINFVERLTPVKGRRIGIFWDCKAFPFPAGMDPDVIFEKIETDLNERGYEGEMSIWAYLDNKDHKPNPSLLCDTWKTRIYFLPGGDKPSRRILNDNVLWINDTLKERNPTLIVVSDKVFCDEVILNHLKMVTYLGYDVIVVGPPSYSSESPEWPELLINEGLRLCEQRPPFPRYRRRNTLGSKIIKFYERITPVKGPQIGVFWDCNAFPFPAGMDPDVIFEKIETDLNERRYEGEMSIWAYVDTPNPSLLLKTWKTRIYFLPGEDKPSRRILNDIVLWENDTLKQRNPALIVVSDKVFSDEVLLYHLQSLTYHGYNVLVVGPPTKSYSSESPEWPELLIDEGLRSSEQGNSSKPVVDDQAVGIKLESQEGNPPKPVVEESKAQG